VTGERAVCTCECSRWACLRLNGARCRSFAACPATAAPWSRSGGAAFQQYSDVTNNFCARARARGKNESEGGESDHDSARAELVRAKFASCEDDPEASLPLTKKKVVYRACDARQGGSCWPPECCRSSCRRHTPVLADLLGVGTQSKHKRVTRGTYQSSSVSTLQTN
jgi:hypothetical protein